MINFKSLIPIIVISLSALAIKGYDRRLKKRIFNAEPRRENLEFSILFENYYGNHGYCLFCVEETLREISTSLKIPIGLIRPTDRFGIEIGAGMILTPELDDLSERALRRARGAKIQLDISQIKCVSDYVSAFCDRNRE